MRCVMAVTCCYLGCLGGLLHDVPVLFLEDLGGVVRRVSGRRLVRRLESLERFRASSYSLRARAQRAVGEPSTQDAGALAAIGPLLAGIGVPAVLAMQGNVTRKIVAEFTPVFFRELSRDGQIDRAVAAAGAAVQDRPDWWVPVLFHRLPHGNLWDKPPVDVEFTDAVPMLPPWYVKRPELDAFEDVLTGGGSRVFGLTGAPGFGKTTLAIALARRPCVRDRFRGVFWVSGTDGPEAVGKVARLITAQRQIALQLGALRKEFQPATWEEGRIELRRLALERLPRSRCLIVVDDPPPDQGDSLIEALDLGESTTLLMTTWNQKTVKAAGIPDSSVLELGGLDPETAYGCFPANRASTLPIRHSVPKLSKWPAFAATTRSD